MAAPEQAVDPYAHEGPWTEAEWLDLPDRWYVRIEPKALTAHLHELRDGAYVEILGGSVLELTEPFTAVVDVPNLLR